jgi:soluble lytic murein transglycosylase
MSYLNNSLVVLIVTIFSLNISCLLHADNRDFILPKKKELLKPANPRIDNSSIVEEYKVRGDLILPRKKPSIIKDISKNVKKEVVKKEVVKKEVVKKEVVKKEVVKKEVVRKEIDKFVYPEKKPIFKVHSQNVARESSFLNKKDFKYAKEIFGFIKDKKWNSALKLTQKVKDKEFKNLVNWMYLKETGNIATFDDYAKFISNNPDYPRINRLRYLAEHKIQIQKTSPTEIIEWFTDQGPLSGTGKLKLSEAYLAINEDKLAYELIKDGWITADLTRNDLKYYARKYKKILNRTDHVKRADYLAWNSEYWDLKRMLPYLPKDLKLLYNARFVLMTHSYGVDKAISEVPENLKKDIGLQYDRLKWRNRRNRLDGSLEILNQAPLGEENLIRADLWWKQRAEIARDLIYKKNYSLAYEVASKHSMSSGPKFAEAEWLSGWLSLSFLKKPEQSIKHFENFYNNVGYPISLARGAFWLGRSYESIGDKEKSNKFYKEGSVFANTYYGQLSFIKIKNDKDFKISKSFNHDKEYKKEFDKNRLIKNIKILKELDQTKYSKDIVKHLATLNIEKGSEVLAAKLATDIDRYDYAIQISKEASYEKRFINFYNYPIINTPNEINTVIMPKQELILSIIRQESEFDSRANSYVGAKGLMQLMPATAKLVAKKIKINYSKSALTKDPSYNIKLGTYYIDSLLKNYNGFFPYAIAAYNAGPNRVKTWKKKYGDPTKGQIDTVDWIELIRFKETRNYVQRVIENINVYRYILKDSPIKIDNLFKG